MNIVAFVGIGCLADSSQASAGTVSRPFTAARIVEIAVGYLTIIGFLFYPIGVLVLSLQLWNTYSYSLADALFAASLVPITSAVGRMLGFLTWAFIAMGITQEIAAAMAMRRVTEDFANSIAP